MIISIIVCILLLIISIIIIHKQNNGIDKCLMNFLLLMIGIVAILYILYIAIGIGNKQPLYLKKPIIISILFISMLLVIMLYNMYFIWKDINSFTKENFFKRYIYNNKFAFFLVVIIFSVCIVITSYGIIYYIINNLPDSIAIDLKGNFMDDGRRKSFGECVYFSAVTFFTVGFGDMIPNGVFFLGVILLEMVTSYLLTIISIPIFLSILIDGLRLDKRK